MLKRLFIIGLLTGTAQLISLVVVKWVAARVSAPEMAMIAEADSMFYFLLNIIALGLQAAAIRNIALADRWQKEFADTQTARFSFSLLLMPLALLGMHTPAYWIFLIAPLLALSGDYAFYGLGKPVQGAVMAFFRGSVPYLALLAAAYFVPGQVLPVYIIGIVAVYMISDVLISRQLGVPLWYRFRFPSLLRYLNSLSLGVANVGLYFVGPGLLLVAAYFYTDNAIAQAFAGIKFYFIYKGVLRIIHQSFLKDMMKEEVCRKVDELSLLVAMAFIISVFIFPASFTRLFFGEAGIHTSPVFFRYLALGAVMYAFVLSQATRLLLERKDWHYCFVAGISAVVAIVLVIFAKQKNAETISLAILVAEIVLFFGLLFSGILFSSFVKRLLFAFRSLLLAVPVWGIGYFLDDAIPVYIGGMLLFSGGAFFLYRKRFSF